jgi:hypothetical protein
MQGKIDLWKEYTLIQGRVIVPIVARRFKSEKWDSCPVRGGDGFLPSQVDVSANFPIELAFAITIYKAQGRTLPRVILSLSHRRMFQCQLSYAAIYVALSRVKESNNIRLLVHDRNGTKMENIQYITALKPCSSIKAFFAGFKSTRQIWNGVDAYNNYST